MVCGLLVFLAPLARRAPLDLLGLLDRLAPPQQCPALPALLDLQALLDRLVPPDLLDLLDRLALPVAPDRLALQAPLDRLDRLEHQPQRLILLVLMLGA